MTATALTGAGIELDPLIRPTLDVEEYATVLGVARATAYAAIHRGEVPVVKVGRRFRVPTAFVRRQLQLDQPEAS